MDMQKLKKPVLIILACIAAAILVIVLSGTPFHFSMDGADKSAVPADSGRIPISVLILPQFEIGEMTGDAPGEAQYFYENMFRGSDEYVIPGPGEDTVMYVKDGRALCLAGVGKVDSALKTTAILSDERFDFSDAYIISVGCGGSARGYSVMGDVVVITGIADYDLGHHADPRDLKDPDGPTWFYDDSLDNCASVVLNRDLTDRVYDLTKDIKLESTDRTRKAMKETFAGEEWADRGPKVIKGADVTGDDFWKGEHGDSNAKLITETYGMPDPFALTDMEEIAKANAAKRLGMGDRYITVRVSVNMDVFMKGESPESLWNTGGSIIENNSEETLDVFPTAMMNNYKVVRAVIKAIDNGEL